MMTGYRGKCTVGHPMHPTAAQHLSAADLAAFALGRLDDGASDWIARRLEDCPACQRVIKGTPGDSVIDLIRKADADRAPPHRPPRPRLAWRPRTMTTARPPPPPRTVARRPCATTRAT